MSKVPATSRKMPNTKANRQSAFLSTGLFILFNTTAFVSNAQPPPIKKDYRSGTLSIAYFIESANSSVNALNSLLKKDNYRNKITTLNNPVNNELGFSLKGEILTALKPLLDNEL
jgi:hypothetical protein